MNTTIKFPVLISALFAVLFLTACRNKIDNSLDKVDTILSKYESKAKDKTMTRHDYLDMLSKVNECTKATFSTYKSEWTQSQKDRFKEQSARQTKLADYTLNLLTH